MKWQREEINVCINEEATGVGTVLLGAHGKMCGTQSCPSQGSWGIYLSTHVCHWLRGQVYSLGKRKHL